MTDSSGTAARYDWLATKILKSIGQEEAEEDKCN